MLPFLPFLSFFPGYSRTFLRMDFNKHSTGRRVPHTRMKHLASLWSYLHCLEPQRPILSEKRPPLAACIAVKCRRSRDYYKLPRTITSTHFSLRRHQAPRSRLLQAPTDYYKHSLSPALPSSPLIPQIITSFNGLLQTPTSSYLCCHQALGSHGQDGCHRF